MEIIKALKLALNRQVTPEVVEKARNNVFEKGRLISTGYEMCDGGIAVRNVLRGRDGGTEVDYYYNMDGMLTEKEIITYRVTKGIFYRSSKSYSYDPPGRFFGKRIR